MSPSIPPSTTASPLTPGGRGAVATVSVSGVLDVLDLHFQAANGKPIQEQQLGRINYGNWGRDFQEDVVVVRQSPSLAEIHCHGGQAAVQRILHDLKSSGTQIISPDDWEREQFSAVQSECRAVIRRATTRLGVHHALRQLTLFPDALAALPALPALERQQQIEDMLSLGRQAQHLLTPWDVVICGRPNVGKSRLLNALVGYERTVVFDQPGTTRDVVSVETAVEGWPIRFSDTAGLRETESTLEAAGIERARSRLQQSDLVLIVLDASTGVQPEERELIQVCPPHLLVWNKTDLAPAPASSELAGVPVSALTLTGLPDLLTTVLRRLVPVPLPTDRPFPMSERQMDQIRSWQDVAR